MGFFSALFGSTDNSQLTEAIKNGAFLVDVRTPSEFAGGSVKGAVNIPLDKLPEQLSKFIARKNIVVFCRSGNRSGQAKNILEQNGFEQVINGGTWQNVNQVVNQESEQS
ncbi:MULTISPECIES: rhodanese-like domain-containing protein [Bacteroidota]|uniref:rhodanese-like domain-containing protein n=1 Tax=Bacteroidota TaxID=976 RepID=UPI001CBB427D|nr:MULTISPECIES: rhodanese-like domain-containing protein [Bacteroidota]MBZ4190774.1 rhodanese-like domain-containing protein [Niabella beijingensis]UMQ40836.1 rhodanese-like domain-containing protein [Chryseobacterium sp. Y16C]